MAGHNINRYSVRTVKMIISFLLLLLCCPSHAITWEDRGGEAIRLCVVTATTTTPSGTYYSVTENGVIAESRDGGGDINIYQIYQQGMLEFLV